MGIIKSSETPTEAAYLRSMRTTTQGDSDELARQHDKDALSASDRWSSVAH